MKHDVIRRQARKLRDELRTGIHSKDVRDVLRAEMRRTVRRSPRVLGTVR